MAPGHTMACNAGTVLIEFRPREEFRKLTEIAEKNFPRTAQDDAWFVLIRKCRRAEPPAAPRTVRLLLKCPQRAEAVEEA